MVKLCKKHGLTKSYVKKDGWNRCLRCAMDYNNKRRIIKKKALIEIFGGKCKSCGYNKCIGALEFHHKNPKEKKFLISGPRLTYSLKRLTEEAIKCDLLCSNCHKEIHFSHL